MRLRLITEGDLAATTFYHPSADDAVIGKGSRWHEGDKVCWITKSGLVQGRVIRVLPNGHISLQRDGEKTWASDVMPQDMIFSSPEAAIRVYKALRAKKMSKNASESRRRRLSGLAL